MRILGKHTLCTLGIAAVTMVASLVMLAPRGADAADEKAKTSETLRNIKAEIAAPSSVEDGCTITLKTDKEAYAAGEKPVLTVEVSNSTDKAIEKTIEVFMSGRDIEVRSRMPAKPRVLWKDSRKVSLAAGEKKTLTLETKFELVQGQAVSFQLGKGGELLEKPIRVEN